MERRTLLKRTGAAATALVLAGCAGPGGEGNETENDTDDEVAVGENDTGAGVEEDGGVGENDTGV